MNVETLQILGLCLAVAALLVGVTTWFSIESRDRAAVSETSSALADLRTLNDQHRVRLRYHPPLRYEFVDRVNSKAKYDRYDLRAFFLQSIMTRETEVRQGIDARLRDASYYAEYAVLYAQIGTRLGRSASERLGAEKYCKIERRHYMKQKLHQPMCLAEVRCTVTYTSPQGQNSYARALAWDFNGLCLGVDEVSRIRTTRSTTQFLRKQERNKMSQSLRAQIFSRDKSRCRMCGASVDDGVTLHVDHIVPVSKGGRTVEHNLQTLCQECNLGKSNRF